MMAKNQKFFSKIIFKSLLSVLILQGLAACSWDFTRFEMSRAESAAENGDYKKAIKYYNKVIHRAPDSPIALKSARAASRLALYELKDFDQAIQMFAHLVTHSSDAGERKSAQKDIAEIAFEKKADYPKAIAEYNKLLTLGATKEELLRYKLRIAKSHFYISEFFQAESEVQDALRVADKGPERFELELFMANIYFNTKRLDEATSNYKKILNEYPELSKNEKVDMSLVISLEEAEKLNEAIDWLEKMRPNTSDPSFIDLKITRLKDRISNRPGARGLRK